MTVDRSIRRGYKSLPEHVNRMDKSMKRHIIVDHMDERSKEILSGYLKKHDKNMWELSDQKLKDDLNAK
jgi:DNA-binding ferritin-like protein